VIFTQLERPAAIAPSRTFVEPALEAIAAAPRRGRMLNRISPMITDQAEPDLADDHGSR
jgi:hypothetical protein